MQEDRREIGLCLHHGGSGSNGSLPVCRPLVQNLRLPHVRVARFAAKPPGFFGSGGHADISAIVAPSDRQSPRNGHLVSKGRLHRDLAESFRRSRVSTTSSLTWRRTRSAAINAK